MIRGISARICRSVLFLCENNRACCCNGNDSDCKSAVGGGGVISAALRSCGKRCLRKGLVPRSAAQPEELVVFLLVGKNGVLNVAPEGSGRVGVFIVSCEEALVKFYCILAVAVRKIDVEAGSLALFIGSYRRILSVDTDPVVVAGLCTGIPEGDGFLGDACLLYTSDAADE